jgi:pyruvate dehydrogenase E1 component alpha subunit
MSDSVAARDEPVRPTELPISLIDSRGTVVSGKRAAGFTRPSDEVLLDLYRKMVKARRFDIQVSALTRQGRLATYPSASGQEGCEIPAVAALQEHDWMFPTYRDSIAVLTRGVPAAQVLSLFRGDWHLGFDPGEHRIAPQATPLATQALHAVGLGTAARLKGDDVVALTFLGDGATSEGDAHEAFNFAAVWQAPVVFLVQNNQYAISVPVAKQTRARTFADKAIGYGMPGYFVDGNDAAAMFAVISAAVERARSGGGPTLIEGLTYRVEAHTNSDDPSRYRGKDEEAKWRELDPLIRLEKYLTKAGVLTPAVADEIAAAAEALATEARDAMSVEPDLDPLELFDHVYVAERPALLEQRAFLERELAATEAGSQS